MTDVYSTFRSLHESGCFVLPNPWDAGGAKRLAAKGVKAIASTSAGAAWALGKDDNSITLDECLAHLKMLCEATALPVNADFEAGFADSPEEVGANVARALETGVAGLSIEDWTGTALYPIDLAVSRISAARAAIDRTRPGALLVGRSEGFLRGERDRARTIERLQAYAAAGADVLYPPGVSEPDDIAAVVEAVAPKPVNILLSTTAASVDELAALGVRRVSTGASLAWAAWSAFDGAVELLVRDGLLQPRVPA